jgi:hypothetical protein
VRLAEQEPGRHRRAHEQHDGRAWRDRGRERLGVDAPAVGPRRRGHEPGHAAREPHAVHEPGVDRVAQHDLLAGLDGREQYVEDPVEAAHRAEALGVRVVRAAGERPDVPRGRLPERAPPLEREPAVRRVVVDRGAGQVQRDLRWPEVGVEVLEPQ